MNMKLLVAVVPAQKLNALEEAVQQCHARRISVTRVVSDDKSGRVGTYRGSSFCIGSSQYRVEFAIAESDVEAAIAALNSLEHTAVDAQSNQLKVFVLPLEASILSSVSGETSRITDVTDGHDSDEVQRPNTSDRRPRSDVPSRRAAVSI